MKTNEINKYMIGNKLNNNKTYNLIFKNFSFDKNVNKINIFCSESDNEQKYILQDIIDINDIKRQNKIYKLKVNKDIFLIPRKNIITSLYSFEHSSNSFNNLLNYYYNIKNAFNYNNLIKIEKIPKYSWNIEFGLYKYLIQSEDDNKIYSFNAKNKELSKNSEFILDETINQINTETNKIISFIKGPEKSPPFLYSEKGDIFSVDDTLYQYRWLEDKERRSNDYPLKISIIPHIKIISLCATNNECYIIDKNGILYENACKIHKDNLSKDIINDKWKKIPVPDNKIKKFIQCSCGDGFLLCLAENKKGKGIIYAKWNNNVFQCGYDHSEGISGNIRGKDCEDLVQCSETENLNFKSIYSSNSFSAAITTDDKLYIWGLLDPDDYDITPIERPSLVNIDSNKDLIVEQISLSYNKLFLIGRVLENDNYIKKLFSLEKEEKNLQENEKQFILKEVKIFDIKEGGSRIVPIKVLVGETKVFVLSINEDELIRKINEDELIKSKNNEF